jgi:hypothetical protein
MVIYFVLQLLAYLQYIILLLNVQVLDKAKR